LQKKYKQILPNKPKGEYVSCNTRNYRSKKINIHCHFLVNQNQIGAILTMIFKKMNSLAIIASIFSFSIAFSEYVSEQEVTGINDLSELNQYAATNANLEVLNTASNGALNIPTDAKINSQYIYGDNLEVLDTTTTKINTSTDELITEDIEVQEAELINDGDINQTMSTSALSKATTETKSTTVTHGWKISKEAGVSIGGASFKDTYEYNGSVATTNTTSTTRTLESPSQSVIVKPHSTTNVKAMLVQNKIDGTFDFVTKLTGTVDIYYFVEPEVTKSSIPFMPPTVKTPDHGHVLKDVPIYELLALESANTPLPDNISLDDEKKEVLLKGQGTYQGVMGSKIVVQIANSDDETKPDEVKPD
jgi:hypothetical protein